MTQRTKEQIAADYYKASGRANSQPRKERLEFIDWQERYPNESSLQLIVRQSTFCPCGRAKEIGEPNCGAIYHRCQNPLHHQTDGTAVEHEVGPSCMAE
jgi:hypothetical protein